MKILVLNGSPKGERSTTLQTVRYLQVLHPEHQFLELPVGQRIKRYEKDFSTPREALSQAEVILFCYPVYTFLVPYQLHRFLELLRADGVDLSGKIATQITTSKHFYDVTAHKFIEANCFDLGMHVVLPVWRFSSTPFCQTGRHPCRLPASLFQGGEMFWEKSGSCHLLSGGGPVSPSHDPRLSSRASL